MLANQKLFFILFQISFASPTQIVHQCFLNKLLFIKTKDTLQYNKETTSEHINTFTAVCHRGPDQKINL